MLESTISSIINQTYTNIQYIVIDGGSTDETLDILSRYKKNINVFISEKDNGIYDAMNKALSFCKGDWINFMNVGDTFYSNNTIELLFKVNYLNTDIIYGNHQVMYPKYSINKKPILLTNIWKGMPIQHQSIFINTKVNNNFNFNTKYKFAADYDLIYNCYINKYKFKYVNEIISKVSANGFSESNSISTYLEYKEISLKYNSNIFHKIYFTFLIPYRRIILILKDILISKILIKKMRYIL
jgi:glycosyltransferase involved in cell wall biosynthesis